MQRIKIKKVFAVFLITLMIYFSLRCSDNTNKHEVITFDNFPTTSDIIHEKVLTKQNLYCIAGMALLDSFLVTYDAQADTFFHVFKLPDFESIDGFIKRVF